MFLQKDINVLFNSSYTNNMNGTLLSFLFFIIIFILYWGFTFIKEYLDNKRLSSNELIIRFNNNLNELPFIEVNKYYLLKSHLSDINNISKITYSNKEYYYVNKKLVLKVTLRTNYISYKFKNKYLLK